MKEYEYIVLATDEIFSHMITSVICLENYRRDDLGGVFRKIFSMFNELRDDYKKSNLGKDVSKDIQLACMRTKCRYQREKILDGYIKEMENIDNTIDFRHEVEEFYKRLEQEDVETLEMQLMVYPYLLSVVRGKEEEK